MAVATAPPQGPSGPLSGGQGPPDAAPAPALPAGAQPLELPRGKGLTAVGAGLAIAADAMVAGALLATWFAVRAGNARWPPKGLKTDHYVGNVITITVIMAAF